LVFPSGAASDPAGKAGTTALMVDMLDEGTKDQTALELSDALQRLATDYSSDVGTDAITLRLNMLASNLKPSIALLRDIVRSPAMPKKEYERRKAQRAASALAKEANPQTGQRNTLRRVLYGKGYGSQSTDGTQNSIPKIQYRDLRRQYDATIAPTGAAFVVVGAVKRASLNEVLLANFGDWTGAPTAKAATVEAVREDLHGIHLVDYPGATQSAIAVVRRDAAFDTPTYFQDKLFNRVLGGAFVSRINMNLREDKGYTYGARTTFARRKSSGLFMAYASVKSNTTLLSLLEIKKELEGISGDKPITDAEFSAAQNGLLLGLPGNYERMGKVAGQVHSVAVFNRPASWLTDYPQKVRGVQIQDAHRTAQRVAQWDKMGIIVAGDRALIEADLQKLGLPIHYYNAEGQPLTGGK